jgi:hypothetical protein
VVLAKDMLSAVLATTVSDWLWHSGMTGNRTEVVLGHCLDEFVEGM